MLMFINFDVMSSFNIFNEFDSVSQSNILLVLINKISILKKKDNSLFYLIYLGQESLLTSWGLKFH